MARDPRVTVRLVGGLGNQMFQYAAALALATRCGAQVWFDLSAYRASGSRHYQLDRLRVPQQICRPPSRQGALRAALSERLCRPVVTTFSRLMPGRYREAHFHFDPDYLNLTGEDLRIEGYFQSPHYFAGAEDRLLHEFQPAQPFSAAAQAVAERIGRAGACSVSLHVRRGDYLSDPSVRAVHAFLGDGYYDRALALMRRLLGGDPRLFLFSDDPDFLAQAFATVPHSEIVRTDASRGWEDMFLMSQCRHHVIANSSYSWWGAWLNRHHEKLVIAPAQWFTHERLAKTDVLDLYPDDWILLK